MLGCEIVVGGRPLSKLYLALNENQVDCIKWRARTPYNMDSPVSGERTESREQEGEQRGKNGGLWGWRESVELFQPKVVCLVFLNCNILYIRIKLVHPRWYLCVPGCASFGFLACSWAMVIILLPKYFSRPSERWVQARVPEDGSMHDEGTPVWWTNLLAM